MFTSTETKNIYKALFAVKKELEAVKKTSNNPFFRSKYADLNAHLELVEPLLEKNGCFLIQSPSASMGTNSVVTRVVHAESGEYVEGSMILLEQNDMQKLGAGVTYARRFILSGLFAMMSEDDDGNTATGKTMVTKTTPASSISSKGAPAAPAAGGFKSAAGKKLFGTKSQ